MLAWKWGYLVVYQVFYTETAVKDIENLKAAYLDETAKTLIELIKKDPYQTPPTYEKLLGDLQGLYSRRINIKHRLAYEVYEEENIIKIVSLWSYYKR